MKSLVENLYNNNVVFSYYGFIDESVLAQILQITKSKLETNKEKLNTVNRVCDAINECGTNISKHNFYADDSKVKYKSLLVISKQDDFYVIDTINVVNNAQKASINEQLEYLHSRSPEELKELKERNTNMNLNSISISSGLLDLVLKADNCECTFKDNDNNYLFNISYKINCLN